MKFFTFFLSSNTFFFRQPSREVIIEEPGLEGRYNSPSRQVPLGRESQIHSNEEPIRVFWIFTFNVLLLLKKRRMLPSSSLLTWKNIHLFSAGKPFTTKNSTLSCTFFFSFCPRRRAAPNIS